MAFERISKVINTLDDQIVWAEGDAKVGRFRVVCSGCPELKDVPRTSGAGAIIAASYHADLDPDERFVLTKDSPLPTWRRREESEQ